MRFGAASERSGRARWRAAARYDRRVENSAEGHPSPDPPSCGGEPSAASPSVQVPALPVVVSDEVVSGEVAPAGADRFALPIHPRFLTVRLLRSGAWLVALCAALGLPLAVWLDSPLALAALALWGILLVGLGLTHARASVRHYRCELAPDGVLVHRGVFWQSETFVPGARIQHTEVTQGPLDRRWGMAEVVVHTAGVHLSTLSLPGLHHADALWLRDRLLERQLPGAT